MSSNRLSTPFPNIGTDGEYFDAQEQAGAPMSTQPTITEDEEPAPPPPTQRLSAPVGANYATNRNSGLLTPSNSGRRGRSSSIRIRRLPSSQRISTISTTVPENQASETVGGVQTQDHAETETSGRKRSFSAPERRDGVMAGIAAESGGRPESSGVMPSIPEARTPGALTPGEVSGRNISSRSSNRPFLSRFRSRTGTFSAPQDQEDKPDPQTDYEDEVANILDVVDPEVSTLATLTNVQNSLFVPDLSIGRFSLVNRRPTYNLTSLREDSYDTDTTGELVTEAEHIAAAELGGQAPTEGVAAADEFAERRRVRRSRVGSITSQLSESHYAVLPHGELLDGWSKEDRDSLNDHVRHMLHSRRSKFKRGMKGFGKYVRRPLGFFVTLYAFLITVFGLVWVLLLIGWISGGSDSRHKYIINIIDNVLVALFAIVGDGLAPFRAIDTYHMCFIAHYATTTWRKRREGEMPKLENRNDLPTAKTVDLDPETGEKNEYSVLTPKQQKRLEHHQKKFARSHTYYKPHETTTHYAFSIRLLITITVLLDCHSLLQIALGAFTWSWSYHTRPAVITTVILCCSISANILAGILISVGDKRSRKTEVVEQMFRQTLTQEAIKKVQRHKREKEKKEQEEKEKALEGSRKAYEGT